MTDFSNNQNSGLVKAATMSLQKASSGLVKRTLRDIESLERTGRITGTELAIMGRTYLVVDLSGGPTALSYPINYLSEVPGGNWTDDYKTMKLVLRRIPAGTFIMGSPQDELGHEENEIQHHVTLTKDFYIGVFPVTQRQWELVMGYEPEFLINTTYRDKQPVERVSYFEIRENPKPIRTFRNIDAYFKGSPISPNWPQSNQVHFDSFTGKLRDKTGLSSFDLPTEAQWEYACRAGTTTAWNSGKNISNTELCPHLFELKQSGRKPCDVGLYLPNNWGLYDFHGNVNEACLDWFGNYTGAATNPKGCSTGRARVCRGGCRFSGPTLCRASCRSLYWPGVAHLIHGFRVALHLDSDLLGIDLCL